MTETARNSKVSQLISEYDLEGVGNELEERWTRSTDRDGLRQLAEYFNRQLLRAALSTTEADPLDGEIKNTYRLLTDESVSRGVRTETNNRLSQKGVDVDRVEQDFVSKQAIHTYLTKVRQVDPPRSASSPAEKRAKNNETIQRLKNRLTTVTERVLGNLRSTDRLTLGEFTVIVNVRVHCQACGNQFPVGSLLNDGACNCDPDQR